jgi:hypothetical protein
MKRPMHLNLFIQSRGHHEAAWRHPKSSHLPLTDIQYSVEMTQKAEAGLVPTRSSLPTFLGLWNRRPDPTPFNWLEAEHLAARARGWATKAHRIDRKRLQTTFTVALQPRAAVVTVSLDHICRGRIRLETSSPPGSPQGRR